jgi:DNA-binding HxlR family transcriptional regulator
MALPRQYAGQACSVAKALEVVGERWSLLIVRDAFFGIRRFSDFATHLDIPRAVLSERLGFLVMHGILERLPVGGRDEYALTEKGLALWPVIRSLAAWGDDFYAPNGPRRLFRHTACDTVVDATGHCAVCDVTPAPADLVTLPGPGLEPPEPPVSPISAALRAPHQLLTPLVGAGAPDNSRREP